MKRALFLIILSCLAVVAPAVRGQKAETGILPGGRGVDGCEALAVDASGMTGVFSVNAQEPTKPTKTGTLPGLRGLAEVIIWVRDLEVARDTYSTLGFKLPPRGTAGTLPSGLKWTGMWFEDLTNLELRAIDNYEKAMRDRPGFVRFLQDHEGARGIVLAVPSAESAMSFLKAQGFELETAFQGRALMFKGWNLPREEMRGPTDASPERVVAFAESPGELPTLTKEQELKWREEIRHQNTALGIKSVWIAVRNLRAGTRAYESVGLRPESKRTLAQIGAEGQEIKMKRGVILLLQPKGKNSYVHSFLADRGEGTMGVSIEVRDLDIARQLLEPNTNRKFTPYRGAYGRSILIPAKLTHGVWIEMFQR